MQYVVCYDIADDRRREHVATALQDFGRRIQESVFLAELEAELAAEMQGRLRRLIAAEDRVHVFALCEGCQGRVVVLGDASVPVDEDFYIL